MRKLLTGILVLLMMGLSACGNPTGKGENSPPPGGTAPPEVKPATVKVGVIGSTSDSPIFIALEKGYFAEQKLKVELVPFDTGTKMIAPLAAGQLDIGGGAVSAGLFNAVSQGVGVKIVADKGSNPPGFGYTVLMVRADLKDRIKGPADVKGLKMATAGGTAGEVWLNRWLQAGKLSIKDIQFVDMGHANIVTAFANKAIDAAMFIEPFVTKAASEKLATILVRQDQDYPDQQVGVLLYGAPFIKDRRDVGERFMVAYLKAARDYNDAFKNNRNKAGVVEILAKHTTVKDQRLYDQVAMPGINPNGQIQTASLASDQEYFLSVGKQKTKVELSAVLDTSFVEKALKVLGQYK